MWDAPTPLSRTERPLCPRRSSTVVNPSGHVRFLSASECLVSTPFATAMSLLKPHWRVPVQAPALTPALEPWRDRRHVTVCVLVSRRC